VTSSVLTGLSSVASSLPLTGSQTTRQRAMSSSWRTPRNGAYGWAIGGFALSVTARQAWLTSYGSCRVDGHTGTDPDQHAPGEIRTPDLRFRRPRLKAILSLQITTFW